MSIVKTLAVIFALSKELCNFALHLVGQCVRVGAPIVLWCNGSTTGFGSVCQGSNPCKTTTTTGAVSADTAPVVVVVLQGFEP